LSRQTYILPCRCILSTARFSFYLHRYADHRDLHSFPTRRSSDLSFIARVLTDTAAKCRGTASSPSLPASQARAVRALVSVSSVRSEEHTSELQSPDHLVCRLLLEKKKKTIH